MNFHSSQLFATGLRLVRCVSLTLLPVLASEAMALTQPQRIGSNRTITGSRFEGCTSHRSRPYLALIMPPALQFQTAPPPVDPALRLAAGAPPRPGGMAEEVAAANHDSVAPHALTDDDAVTDIVAPEPALIEKVTPAVVRLAPVSILPDDTPRDIRAEDVLPFFQFPGSTPSVPAPAALPPSSATYRQR